MLWRYGRSLPSPASPGRGDGRRARGSRIRISGHRRFTIEGEDLRPLATGCSAHGAATGRTAVLLHGRNFPQATYRPSCAGCVRLPGRGSGSNRLRKSSKLGFAYSSTPWPAPRSPCSTVFMSIGSTSWDIRGRHAGGPVAPCPAYASRIDHLILFADRPEDHRCAPPVTDDELARRERESTADGYRKQLMTNYALSSRRARSSRSSSCARRSKRAANIRAG